MIEKLKNILNPSDDNHSFTWGEIQNALTVAKSLQDEQAFDLNGVLYSFKYSRLEFSDKSICKLSTKENNLLKMLTDCYGELVKGQDMLMTVWKTDSYFVGRSRDVFIARLRKVLKNHCEILNVHGEGYILLKLQY